MKSEKLIGTLLIIASGFIYSFDRAVVEIINTLRSEGNNIANAGGSYTTHLKPFNFDNIFAWVFLILGIIILIYSYISDQKKKVSIP